MSSGAFEVMTVPASRSAASEYERRRRQQERDAERAQRAAIAARKAADREDRKEYLVDRAAEAERRTHDLDDRVEELRSVLVRGLRRPARIELSRLRRHVTIPPFSVGPTEAATPPPEWSRFEPPAPSTFGRMFGGDSRYQRQVSDARVEFERAMADHDQEEADRRRRIVEQQRRHEQRLADEQRQVDEYNRSLDDFSALFEGRDQAAVGRYLDWILKGVPLPSDFPRTSESAFSARGEQAVLRFELPGPDVVPAIRAVQYVQSKDEYRDLPRPAKETGELYRLVVSQVALLCLRDVFAADAHLQSVAFNGHVWATNPATGQREYPCLISLSVDRADFEQLVLKDVRPEVCLRHLRALVSAHPYELEPIKPIVDFDLSKYRFIDGLDAVSTLDSRPDLMDLTPDEFEHLVRQIFEATGLEGWTTAHSKDDGVDAVMVNKTPGGAMLCIVQAKRYSKVVGVSHVRELAGAMEEKRAGHGILVTTSWFTGGCWQKAREHGRMELFDGPRLVSMIKEHLNKDVLIGIDRPGSASTGPAAGQAGSPPGNAAGTPTE